MPRQQFKQWFPLCQPYYKTKHQLAVPIFIYFLKKHKVKISMHLSFKIIIYHSFICYFAPYEHKL